MFDDLMCLDSRGLFRNWFDAGIHLSEYAGDWRWGHTVKAGYQGLEYCLCLNRLGLVSYTFSFTVDAVCTQLSISIFTSVQFRLMPQIPNPVEYECGELEG